MKHPVTLLKQVKLDGVWKRYPVVLNKNGTIKPGYVTVAGKPKPAPDGNYILDWYEGGKRLRQSVGKDAADALIQRDRKVAELEAARTGLVVTNGDTNRHLLSDAVAEFLDETKLTKKPKTLAAYTTAMTYFTESCSKLYVEDVDRKDLLKFAAFLRDVKEQAPRSVHNKFENVMSFLKAQGVRGLVKKADWPQFTEEEPEV
jgi:integrase/recombinase XerD